MNSLPITRRTWLYDFNAKKVEGAVLFLSLRNALGEVTDEFPTSTFLVSQ